MPRVFASIFLILILIFQFSGGQLLFHINRSQIRREVKTRIKEGVPQSQLTAIKFSLSGADYQNLEWHENHEFRFKGRMYDVVKREQRGDSIFFHCIDDHQETTLFAKLDELVKNRWNNGPARQQQQKITAGLSSFYLPVNDIALPLLLSLHAHTENPYSFQMTTWVKLPDSPPPRFIS